MCDWLARVSGSVFSVHGIPWALVVVMPKYEGQQQADSAAF
jgi:hypothetical protein